MIWCASAHWGPAFLPWHREFLRQFESALRKEVPGVASPYWDSTLDEGLFAASCIKSPVYRPRYAFKGLPDASGSVVWSDELLGNGNGYVSVFFVYFCSVEKRSFAFSQRSSCVLG